MKTRFQINLLQAGRVRSRWDWVLGPDGLRHLAIVAACAATAWIVLVVGGTLPLHLRVSADLARVKQLQAELTRTTIDADVLKANLGALATEARHQLSWNDLLTTLTAALPPTLRLERVSFLPSAAADKRSAQAPRSPAAASSGAAAPLPEVTLQIEASTPLRPGGPPLLEIAQFMAATLSDAAVSQRFQLQSWEIKPPGQASGQGPQLLQIVVVLAERKS